ncbi:arsenosugar biosynthesis radical SAM (seleno)protein ArsS [Rubellicoccus peritrichatus]|uniref:Arsenosugar biosynthesis radical SAM protein ArsS n=1 Tax=Rubellicoccus peritrichatus TaxID=3080537 RepID=A0AAQ3L5V5_9BACT|nr:arsenosugar biosynthesis radical SAM (seleno)protein ArsS [Puniceicoccus sp. CR14]WOO39626.1 arsenosugar biosynthesis radical SAM protein ArsS [Puniceicoccus sp. CR14]
MPSVTTALATDPFASTLDALGINLRRKHPTILQLNIGRICNLTCQHCHVNAGPWRKEIMSVETIDRIVDWLAQTDIPTVDLTGGAPEMVPGFKHLIERLKSLTPSRHIIDRCNLTILLESGYEYLGEFLAKHQIEIVASMPCYCPENVNAQRGEGTFDASIEGLQLLNQLGYGRDPDLPLHLVYNPIGDKLPPEQQELEDDYKRELKEHFDIDFDRLYTITNMPISRFESYLKQNGKLAEYMQLLIDNFNPAAIDGLMCRDTISVDHLGRVYDCDFNQMLGIPAGNAPELRYLWDTDINDWSHSAIATGKHCFGCTAGAGSSCQGTTA